MSVLTTEDVRNDFTSWRSMESCRLFDEWLDEVKAEAYARGFADGAKS